MGEVDDKDVVKKVEQIDLNEEKGNSDAKDNLKDGSSNTGASKNTLKNSKSKNVAFLVIGMAGSGKTTFCQRLYSWISQKECEIDKTTGLNKRIYSVNLDPAVVNPKMPLNVDIRDYVDHNDVMINHKLGPNGATSTCLNLFLLQNGALFTNIDADYTIIDTPGQIESFTWSSAGYAVLNYLKQGSKVLIVYVIDGQSSQEPSVFMSNMIYSISLESRYNVPVLCAFNKNDLADFDNIERWIRDYEEFRVSLSDSKHNTHILGTMALYFEEFYNDIDIVSLSSYTGDGKESLFKKVKEILNRSE